MLNRHAVDYPHVPSQPALLPLSRDPGGMLSRFVGMLSRNDKPPNIWDTRGKSGNDFVNPPASSSSPYPPGQGFNPWISNITQDTSPHVTSERQNQDTTLDPRCQSGPSARNSFDPKEGRFSKNYGADQQRLQISDLHFDKFPNPATFACWKIRFKTEVCTCSHFPTDAMLWIKEVEMVDSVDELRSSSSVRGISMPNFEVLDARIASALNRIVHNSHFKRRISLEEQKAQKQDRFLRGRQYGASSEESWTWLSQIEDSGKKKYRAEFENEEFWGQKQKLWNKRRGQESGDKTAWTKKSRRLSAMES